MKKTLALLAVAVTAILALSYANRKEKPAWTTTSPEALAELQRGLEAMSKVYHGDAIHHLQEALELDPDFAAALVFLSRGEYSSPEQQAVFLQRLEQVDLEDLQPRERALVEFTLARAGGDYGRSQEILERYLEEHDKDPVILQFYCSFLDNAVEVEDCFRLLISVNPNWVQAQNRLGYLAMAQGDFEEAEERFRTYQYVAPDQANPHDSMGELLLLLGRFSEAEKELETAIELRPDFTASYHNLIRYFLFEGDPKSAGRILERALTHGAFEEGQRRHYECLIDLYKATYELHWERIWQVTEACADAPRFYSVAERYRAALWTGRLEEAQAMLDRVETIWQEGHDGHNRRGYVPPWIYEHIKGISLQVAGDQDAAVEAFQRADRHLLYEGLELGWFKLVNRMSMADALELAGRQDIAGQVLEEVRQVNPAILRYSAVYAMPRPPQDDSDSAGSDS